MREPLKRFELLDKGYLELLDLMPHPLTGVSPDMTVVNAARISYLGESKGPKKDRRLLRYLMRHKHWTPFEHVQLQFRVKCPLFVARQWFRHRTHHYNELSRRYTSRNMEFYIPEEWREQDTDNKQSSFGTTDNQESLMRAYCSVIDYAERTYDHFLQFNVAKEMARMMLPQSMYTEFYDTCDLRNLLGFVKLRYEEHAQYEIQVYGKVILECIEKYCPWTAQAFKDYML